MGLSILDAVERFDLLAYVRDRGATEEQRGEWSLPCPLCGKSDKLIVNVQKKTWHCWVCQEYETVITSEGPRRRPVRGAGGLLDLIQFLENLDKRQAVERILATVTPSHNLYELPVAELTADLQRWYQPAPAIPFPENAVAIQSPGLPYMREREISMQDVWDFGLFWCDAGRYGNRLVFPVYEENRFVYFQARAMWPPQPGERYVKALNPSRQRGSAVSSEVLMNLDRARRCSRVAIVEGPMDCVRAGLESVCTFGKAISPTQIAKLVRAGVRAIDLMWDADAQEEMARVVPLLSALFDVRVVYLPQGDPADFTRAQLTAFRQQAVPMSAQSRLTNVW